MISREISSRKKTTVKNQMALYTEAGNEHARVESGLEKASTDADARAIN